MNVGDWGWGCGGSGVVGVDARMERKHARSTEAGKYFVHTYDN